MCEDDAGFVVVRTKPLENPTKDDPPADKSRKKAAIGCTAVERVAAEKTVVKRERASK